MENSFLAIKVERKLFDYFLWLEIENKYQMKYLNPYSKLEEEFINDLISKNMIQVYVGESLIRSYEDLKKNVENKLLSYRDFHRIRRFIKKIYNEIEDYSDFGKCQDLIEW